MAPHCHFQCKKLIFKEKLSSWGSQGKNTEVACHSLLQWNTFCQTSPPWLACLGLPRRHGLVSLREGLGAGGEGDDRGWDDWMASLTRWTWIWVNSGSWWWTGRPGVLRFMGSQRVGTRLSDWTELNWSLVCDFFVLRNISLLQGHEDIFQFIVLAAL